MEYTNQYPAGYKPSEFSPLGGSLQQSMVAQAGVAQQASAASAYPQQSMQSLPYSQQAPVQAYPNQQIAQQEYYGQQQPALPQQYCSQQSIPQQYYSQQMPAQQSNMQQAQYQEPWGQQLPASQPFYQQQNVPMQTPPGLQPNFNLPQSDTSAVLGAQYCAQGEQIFFVNEKWASLSGDDFTILDRNRQPAFKLDSSAFSLKQKRVLKTIKGEIVCSLKKKVSITSCLTALRAKPHSAEHLHVFLPVETSTMTHASTMDWCSELHHSVEHRCLSD